MDKKKLVRTWLPVLIALVMLPLLDVPIRYVLSPNDELAKESLWKSYDENKSIRIKFLLWRGADPNYVTPRGFTPLIEAAMWNNPDGVNLLIEAGADPSIGVHGVRNHRTPMDFACRENSTEVIDLLANLGYKPTVSPESMLYSEPVHDSCQIE